MNFLFILSYSLCDARVGREALLLLCINELNSVKWDEVFNTDINIYAQQLLDEIERITDKYALIGRN